MSQIDLGEQAERDWECWLADNGYEVIYGTFDEFYECPGNHINHVSDLQAIYEEERNR